MSLDIASEHHPWPTLSVDIAGSILLPLMWSPWPSFSCFHFYIHLLIPITEHILYNPMTILVHSHYTGLSSWHFAIEIPNPIIISPLGHLECQQPLDICTLMRVGALPVTRTVPYITNPCISICYVHPWNILAGILWKRLWWSWAWSSLNVADRLISYKLHHVTVTFNLHMSSAIPGG